MASATEKRRSSAPFNILLIGNNPIELSSIYEELIKMKDRRIVAETAFDLQSVLKSKMRCKPSFILIDDNVGKLQLKELIEYLSHESDTKDIPITIIKNSNYTESTDGAYDYILKQSANGETIASAFIKALQIKEKQNYVAQRLRMNKKKAGFKSGS